MIQIAPMIAWIGAAAFSILLILLHFLKPENDPSWRMISEYQIGRYGWLMRLAFFCWSLGLFGLVAALWQYIPAVTDTLLAVIAASILGAGIFVTQPITTPNELQSRSSKLHTLFGAITIIGTPFVVTAVDWSLGRNPLAASIQPYLLWLTLMVWLGFLVFVSAMVYYGSKRIALGPQAKIGWPNRFMVFTYIAWLIIVAGGIYQQPVLSVALAQLQSDIQNVTPHVVDASQAVNAQPPTPQEQKIKNDVVALLLASQPDNTDFYSQLWVDAIGRRYVLVTQPIAESSYDEVIDSQTGTVTPIPEAARWDLEPLGRNAMLYIDAQHIYLYTLDQPAPTLVPGSALSGDETYTSGEVDNPSISPSMSYTPNSITITIFDTSKPTPNPKLGVGATMNGAVRETTLSF